MSSQCIRNDSAPSVVDCPLIQLCFVVENLEQAMAQFSLLAGAGPWFILPRIPTDLDSTVYRGVPTPLGACIALAYAGNLMYELVCPDQGSSSIFKEWADIRGYGLHHLGYAVSEFDALMASIESDAVQVLMTSKTPRGARVVMIQGEEPEGVLAEYIEIIPASCDFYSFMRKQSLSWDRQTLIFAKSLE
nr:VOC family protein [Pseudomonas caspiana]